MEQVLDFSSDISAKAVVQLFHFIIFIKTQILFFLHCVFPYFFIKHREKLYQKWNNRFLIWILDSFLSPKIIFQEFKTKQWKKIFCRTLIYFYSICFFPVTLLFFGIFLVSMFFEITKSCYQWLQYPFQTNFNYQTLPSTIQQRFHQLQPSLIKYNLSKAFFNPSFISEYNDLQIDQLFVMKQEGPCPKFDEYYDINTDANIYPPMSNLLPKLSFRCYQNSNCSCEMELFNQFQVSKNISVSNIPLKINLFLLPLFNKIQPKELVITKSILSIDDFQIISKLNLDFIKLSLQFDGTNFENKFQQMLIAVVGTPKIRLEYEDFCGDIDDFKDSMMEWLYNNDYVQSINCKDIFQDLCFSYYR